MLDCNPVFTAPGFGAALGGCRSASALATALDETGAAADWFVPLAHAFETWGDARGHDGTATILQPQALPLYGGWSALEMLALFAGSAPRRSAGGGAGDLARPLVRPGGLA